MLWKQKNCFVVRENDNRQKNQALLEQKAKKSSLMHAFSPQKSKRFLFPATFFLCSPPLNTTTIVLLFSIVEAAVAGADHPIGYNVPAFLQGSVFLGGKCVVWVLGSFLV